MSPNSRCRRFAVQNVFVIMLLLWHRCVPQEVLHNTITINGAFITLHGYILRGPKLERYNCRGMLQCGHLCLKNPQCFSFNYQDSIIHSGLCELSEESIASKEDHEKLTKMSAGFIFVQTVRKDLEPRSCLVYLQAGWRFSGFYNIFDNEGSSFPVYCDLTSEPKAAWTLFMSERTPGFGLFKGVPLYVNKPMNESNPHWNVFRLSLAKMRQLRSLSSHWRVTCSFQLDGLVLRDHVRARVVDFDPIDFKGWGTCKKVEYVNVRGHTCSNCDVAWWQDGNEMLHHDSSKARCGFDPSAGAVASEDCFGSYDSFNTKFRCTESGRESTTNYWFGSYLE